MTTRYRTALCVAVVCSALGVSFADNGRSPAPGLPDAGSDAPATPLEKLEKFTHEFDLLPGLGRPPATPRNRNADPPMDLGPDPLGDVANGMTDVHTDLSQYKTDKPVQQKEKDIVDTLDKLIVALTPKGSGNGGGNNPGGTGRKKSGIYEGQAAIGDLHGVDSQGRPWDRLPPRERERILQSRTEGFPPGYEALLQNYYQRLAQEKSADEKPPETPATLPGTH